MNLDLEGFFMLLLLGTGGAAVGHTMIMVIAGPMLFGRVLCGWGCWRSMILELLPAGRKPQPPARTLESTPVRGVDGGHGRRLRSISIGPAP